jgi:hypothetical protein
MNKILLLAAIVAILATTAVAQQCNGATASKCGTDYQSCVLLNSSNLNAVCSCFINYYSCLRSSLTDSAMAIVKNSCLASGCPAATCNSAASISGFFGLFVAAVAAFF